MPVAIVRSEKEITPRQRLGFHVAGGRGVGHLPGTHIDDLAATRKAIWLCPPHAGKFNFLAYRYQTSQRMPRVGGRCDACDEFHPECVLFMPIER